MRDPISISRIKLLHPDVRGLFFDFITEAENHTNTTLRVVQGLRTIEEQNELYRKGRSLPGPKVTNAHGGRSYHNYGLAVDLVEIKDGKANWNFAYEKIEAISKKYGLTWGGRFRQLVDKPHYEMNFGLTTSELLSRTIKGKFVAGTKYVQL